MAETATVKAPVTGAIIDEYKITSPQEIQKIYDSANAAFPQWSATSLHRRMQDLRATYQQFYANSDMLAKLVSDEMGKPLHEAYSSEILPVLDCFKYYLKNIRDFLKPTPISAQNIFLKLRKGFVVWEPLGVIGVITPWNYPLLLSLQHIIPALLAGNTVIHKPSEYSTLTGLKIDALFDNFPVGVFSTVTGFSETGQALVAQDLDKIFFIGSTNVGRKIYQSAADKLIPVNMELGGNDPMIVLEDADLERAGNGALWGAFSNSGQTCVSVERFFVQESIFEEFRQKLLQKISTLRIGNQTTGEGEITSMVNQAQLNKMNDLIAKAKKQGVHIEIGGKPRPENGSFFFEPTLLTFPDAKNQLSGEEIFGPVVSLQSFKTDDEAIAMANNSEYGLSASIWSKNPDRALQIAHQIKSGSVLINELFSHISQFEAPYSGWKSSGIGVSHGSWGMQEMVRPKYISAENQWLQRLLAILAPHLKKRNLWWFPYRNSQLAEYRAFVSYLHAPSLWSRIKATPTAVKAIFKKPKS